ncbi:MAG: type II toxin-antitoxin system VapC family toxin [Chloroflexi bacterium]|nr:type II toxin-antitoxin system VapC family toxin [Chloroflexota bacterium]
MSPADLPGFLGLDTNCLIYLLEGQSAQRQAVMERVIHTGRRSVVSTLAVAEMLVARFRRTDENSSDALAAIEALPGLEIVAVDVAVAARAAAIRAETGLKLPDAVHVATALYSGAEGFLTNDIAVARADVGLPVFLVDSLT